mgnify:CR=1 FL=1
MIEIFLEAPLELKVIILSVLTIAVYEFLKEEVSSWKKQQSKRNWKENYHPDVNIKQRTRI